MTSPLEQALSRRSDSGTVLGGAVAAGTSPGFPDVQGTAGMSLPGAYLLLAKPGVVAAETAAGILGLLLAAPSAPSAATLCQFTFCLVLTASGAAMANGILDRKLDRKMPRLAERCHALELAGVKGALVAALLLISCGLALSAYFFDVLTPLLLAVSCCCYLFLYTRWLKRHSPWGVIAGGIPGGLPPLIGAAAVSGINQPAALLLATLILVWQLPHFWFLALQFRDQYQAAGIPVLPVSHGEKTTRHLTLAGTLLLLPCLLAFIKAGHFSPPFVAVSISAWLIFLATSCRFLYRTADYRSGFRASLLFLAVIFASLAVEIIFSRQIQ